MDPNLLQQLLVECLKSFISSLVAGKASPFMVATIDTELDLGRNDLSLIKP